MTPEQWHKIEEIFEAALEREPEERAAFLDEVCKEDAALRREVELMLAHEQPTGKFISTLVSKAAQLLPVSTASARRDGESRFIPGTVLAHRYRITGMVGRGGMGEVYRADDLKLNQAVALKFLPEKLSQNAAMLEHFHREVRTARQVSHPNVCRVFDIGEIDGQHFLSMEYIDGEDLSSLLRRIGRLPEDKAVEVARQLCAGLAAAHAEGVLHRDLKPANVMIDGRGRARITDFGLAGLAEEIQAHEVRSGTPAYMAPEQLNGKEVSVKSDIYSLGLLLYEVFTGRRAFAADTLEELKRQRETSQPPSISSLIKEVNPLVERVIQRCLERDPERRPVSVLHVAASLPGGDPLAAAVAAGETPSPEMVAAAQKEGALRPWVASLMLAAVVAELLLIVLLSKETKLYNLAPLMKTPEVLLDRASAIARKLGYEETPVDTAYGFEVDRDYMNFIEEQDKSPTRWQKFRSNQPGALLFWHRRSPRHLEPKSDIRVTMDDPPPLLLSGMLDMKLDTEGRLLALTASPPQLENAENAATTAPAPDWKALFDEAGLQMEKFTPATARWVPPTAYDTRAAWEGVFPSAPETPMRVEAAAFKGKPVYFEVLGPWSQPYRMRPLEASAGTTRRFVIIFLVFMGVIVTCAVMARRNLRLGRGDRKGAMRLALIIFSLSMISWLFVASHVPVFFGELTLFWYGVAWALIYAGVIWLLYVAVEPYVRRKTPHRIISWSRLMAGDFRDPMVGRDVLIGMLFGVGFWVTVNVMELTDRWMGRPADVSTNGLDGLLGLPHLVGRILLGRQPMFSLLHGIGYTFLILLFSLILRKGWLAAAALWLLFMSQDLVAARPLSYLIFQGVIAAALVLAVSRYGLLATAVGYFFYFMGLFYPYTSDFSAWYAGGTIFALAISLAFAIYGFLVSLGGQPLFRTSLLED
jgi:serine/threonine-protein kinase